MARTVYICSNCKTMYNDRKMVSSVVERDRSGKYTGRVLNLCTNCSDKFLGLEIKDIADRLDSNGRLKVKSLGWTTNDLQSYLTKWNKFKKERR